MGSSIRRPSKYVSCVKAEIIAFSLGLTTVRIAFGHILTRLTAAKEEGAFVTAPDGSKIALGIPKAQKEAAGSNAYVDIPLRRPGTATEAASVILAVASPLFSYVDGQTISKLFTIRQHDAVVTDLESKWSLEVATCKERVENSERILQCRNKEIVLVHIIVMWSLIWIGSESSTPRPSSAVMRIAAAEGPVL